MVNFNDIQPSADLTQQTIKDFLDIFYTKIRKHNTLGPVFGLNIPDDDWPEHMEKVYSFWIRMVLRQGVYKGNMMRAHMGVRDMTSDHIPQWIALFKDTAHECLSEQDANVFLFYAQNIGRSLDMGLFHKLQAQGQM